MDIIMDTSERKRTLVDANGCQWMLVNTNGRYWVRCSACLSTTVSPYQKPWTSMNIHGQMSGMYQKDPKRSKTIQNPPTFPSKAAQANFWNSFPARSLKCQAIGLVPVFYTDASNPTPNISYTFEQRWEISFRCRSGLCAPFLFLTHMPWWHQCQGRSLSSPDQASLVFRLAPLDHSPFWDQLSLVMGTALSYRIAGREWSRFPKLCQEPAPLARQKDHRTWHQQCKSMQIFYYRRFDC